MNFAGRALTKSQKAGKARVVKDASVLRGQGTGKDGKETWSEKEAPTNLPKTLKTLKNLVRSVDYILNSIGR